MSYGCGVQGGADCSRALSLEIVPQLEATSWHWELPLYSKQGRDTGRVRGKSFSQDVALELAHSDCSGPPGYSVKTIWFSVFPQSVHQCLEVIRHTEHLDAAHSPRSSPGLEWSVFNPITGKPNLRSIDFKFLSICFT